MTEFLLLISKSSQLLSEPLFLFRKLLFYAGTLWLGASFLIILRIVRSEGDSQLVLVGAAKHLAVHHARGTRVFSLFTGIKQHYFKI